MSDDGIQAWAPMEVVEALLARAEDAEAAIQRARELCVKAKYQGVDGTDEYVFVNARDVLRALDGPDE